jgi:hypothetical protein
MFRIDNTTVAGALPAPTPVGTPGYFTDGSAAGGIPATIVSAEFLNMVQEELVNAIQAFGLVPSKSTFNQLAVAMRQSRLQRWTAAGSWLVPIGVTAILLSAVPPGGGGAAGGGGGGTLNTYGGGGGSGGAGQSVLRQLFAVVPGTTISWTMGTAGFGGTGITVGAGNPGGTGGDIVFTGGISLTLKGGTGGAGGVATNASSGAAGGGAGLGFPNGSYGTDGIAGSGCGVGGVGASSPFGGGGGSGRASFLGVGIAGAAGGGFGSGGGGGGGVYGTGSSTSFAGGAGGAGAGGLVEIEW